ncbi:unnamed protein product [Chironomus riparius]|uniref:1-acylglycerol-3-phosphate O-acyltransferase n=1 Tax=Chironomus riparius TaxID=315576 RepID=A0A9P0ITR4_9DIPT|nr:unnamed protein product [Chironomus riparius]
MFLVIACLVILAFVCSKLFKGSNVFKYYFKYTVYCILSTICAIICFPFLLARARNVQNLITASKVFRLISPVLGLEFEFRGMEHLKKGYTCVIVANHQSSIDILCMYELWPIMGKTTVIARMLLLFAGPFGPCAWLSGLVFINKDSPDKGIRKINHAMEDLKKKNIKLWMYPEGYRNHSGNIDEFKKGAFRMAQQSQVPIVPVVISSYNFFLRPKDKVFNSGKIIIEALHEIPTKGLKSTDVNALLNKTRNVMIEKFNTLNYEINNEQHKKKK